MCGVSYVHVQGDAVMDVPLTLQVLINCGGGGGGDCDGGNPGGVYEYIHPQQGDPR